MNTLDLIFRSANGLAAVANGYSFAVPPDSRRYLACKAVTVACDAVSYLTLHAKSSLTLHRAERYQAPHLNKHFWNFVIHEASCILAGVSDVRGMFMPNEAMLFNGASMTVQGMNAVFGTDPNRIEHQVNRWRP